MSRRGGDVKTEGNANLLRNYNLYSDNYNYDYSDKYNLYCDNYSYNYNLYCANYDYNFNHGDNYNLYCDNYNHNHSSDYNLFIDLPANEAKELQWDFTCSPLIKKDSC